MDQFFYRLLMALVKWSAPSSINMKQLQAIVSAKLLMDRRRVPPSWKQKQQKESSNSMLVTFITYSIFGLFIGAMIFFVPSLIVVMTLLHSYLLFMLIMTLITDFSTVLLDNTDAHIIQPKPVDGRTFFMARAIHISIYLSQLLTALMLFPIIFAGIKYGILISVVLLFTTLLTALLAIFLTYLLYGLVIRFSSEQKVKDIVGYLQVFMTIFFAVAYQVAPRLIDLDNLNFDFTLHWYSYLLPPVWMALFVDAVQHVNFDAVHLSMIACAVILPVLICWITIKYLAPYFSSRLNALQGSGQAKAKKGTGVNRKNSFAETSAAIVCESNNEKASFLQTWRITARDKSFKMQFYPSLAYIPVFIFVIVFKNFDKLSQNWHKIDQSNYFILFIYLGILSVSTAIMIIPYNENFSAAWVYQSTPISKPGELISGAVKALWTKYFLPMFLLLTMFCIYIWGLKVADDILLGLLNNSLIVLLMTKLGTHLLPFSMQPNIKQQSGKFLKMILQFIIIGALILIHYLAIRVWWLVPVLIPLSAAACWLLLRQIQKIRWWQVAV